MLVESLVLALVGAVVGAAAVALLRRYFPQPPSLAVCTGAAAALVAGLVARATLGAGHTLLQTALGAVTAALLVSVLARPDRVVPARHRRRTV
ncbi:hypothetical protein ACIQGZ_05965 [Streptomyces sp. NPDC092296]|uniref:hypothetical protein n=1 Tax=Streptomyces sp. NPDC092296 TaxID=3366012 RepID=UPI00380AF247